MNAKYIEHSHAGDGQRGSGRRSLLGGKVTAVFALVMAGLIGTWVFISTNTEAQVAGGQDGAVAFAAPAQTPALPAISPNAVEQRSPSF